jgi:hypothetical protein
MRELKREKGEKLWNMNAPRRDKGKEKKKKKRETKYMFWELFECCDRICKWNIQMKSPLRKVLLLCFNAEFCLNMSIFFFFVQLIRSGYTWNTRTWNLV